MLKNAAIFELRLVYDPEPETHEKWRETLQKIHDLKLETKLDKFMENEIIGLKLKVETERTK